MDWLKELSPAGLIAACLLYQIRFFGNCLSKLTAAIENLVAVTHEMRAKVDDCPNRGGQIKEE
jgi:hypothetical protein